MGPGESKDLGTQTPGMGAGNRGTRLERAIETSKSRRSFASKRRNASKKTHLKDVETLIKMNKLEVGFGALG